MSEICGWLGSASSAGEAAETARIMAASLAGSSQAVVATPELGLIAQAGQDVAWDPHTNRAAAVDGPLKFADATLAALAASEGRARALLEGHRKLGDALFAQLLGAFSVVVLDGRARTAVAAVDRLGIRPLCFATPTSTALVFGSTAASVAAFPGVGRKLNPQAIFDYTFLHVVAAPRTIYAGISKLEPAQKLTVSARGSEVHRYWQPSFASGGGSANDASLAEELRTTLATAVESSMGPEPTGSFLSGGLDSSTVTGYAARSGKLAHAYTIGFRQKGYDESDYAKLAASHFGADLKLYYVTPDDVAKGIRDVARAYDEPFGNSSALPALFCARAAREDGVKVLLAGDGGDELFAGNERYTREKLLDYYAAVPSVIRNVLLEPIGTSKGSWVKLPIIWKLHRYVEQARVPAAQRAALLFDQLKGMPTAEIFEPEFLAKVDTSAPREALAAVYDAAPATEPLDRLLFLDWKITLADNDLRKVNRMCEVEGVEVRYPMLDDRVVELSTRIPASLKMPARKLRDFYKRAFGTFLPQEIINKKKHGFGLPFGEWLKTEPVLRDLCYPLLEKLKQRGIFRPACIDQLVVTHRDGHASYYGSMVWALVMLELWLEEHADVP